MTTTQEELTRLVIDQTGCEETRAIEALAKTGNNLVDAVIYLETGHIPPKRTLADGEDSAQYEWVESGGRAISAALSLSNDPDLRAQGIRMEHYLSKIDFRRLGRPGSSSGEKVSRNSSTNSENGGANLG